MSASLQWFERASRLAYRFTERETDAHAQLHPFDRRNIHPDLPKRVRQLFDDGHYPEATFLAFKSIDKAIQKHSKLKESGYKLMMAAFDEASAKIQLTPLKEVSEIDEQRGYRFMFSGAVLAIRNPRGHEVDLQDDPDTCLDHLAFASLLLRRLELAGYR